VFRSTNKYCFDWMSAMSDTITIKDPKNLQLPRQVLYGLETGLLDLETPC